MKNLTWSEEFTGAAGSAPDSRIWSFELGGGGWGCGQLQHYTDHRDNATVNGSSQLTITARRAAPPPSSDELAAPVTSARLTTRGRLHLRYGRIQARIKVPTGRGMWPALWMLGADIDQVGWPGCGEIDIMESVGSDPTTVHGTIHGPGFAGLDHGIGRAHDTGVDLATGFHVYGVDWTPHRITWHIDGRPYSSLTPEHTPDGRWPFRHDSYLIVNLAVSGDWPGNRNDRPDLPASMLVDWIRAYGSTVTLLE